MNPYLFFNLLVAHIVADFHCQTGKSCNDKYRNGLRGASIYRHALFVFGLSMLAAFDITFWWAALTLAVAHLLTDAIKSRVERYKPGKNDKTKKPGKTTQDEDNAVSKPLKERQNAIWIFLIDQVIHVAAILGVAWWWNTSLHGSSWRQIELLSGMETRHYAVLIAVLLLLTPSNILVNLIFQKFTIPTPDRNGDEKENIPAKEHGHLKSGALIGSLERLIVLAFVLLKQFEAIGLLIAAKSILRFNEVSKTEKSEYVLVGTLISIVLALMAGIFILNI